MARTGTVVVEMVGWSRDDEWHPAGAHGEFTLTDVLVEDITDVLNGSGVTVHPITVRPDMARFTLMGEPDQLNFLAVELVTNYLHNQGFTKVGITSHRIDWEDA